MSLILDLNFSFKF